MDRVIAQELVAAELNVYQELSFDELRQVIDERSARIEHGREGVEYSVETLTSENRAKSFQEP